MLHGSRHDGHNHSPAPVLAELLRTCVYPQSLTLRVEHVVRQDLKENQDEVVEKSNHEDDSITTVVAPTTINGHTVRLFVTDGHLLIQALLHRRLHNLSRSQDIRPGDIIEIHKFQLKRSKRCNGDGHVMFLAIDECDVHRSGNSEKYEELEAAITTSILKSTRGTKRHHSQDVEEDFPGIEDEAAGGFLREDEDNHTQKRVRAESPYEALSPNKTSRLISEVGGNNGQLHSPETPNSSPEDDHTPTQLQFGTLNQITPHTSAVSIHQTPSRTKKSKSNLEQDSMSEDEDAFETIRVDHDTTEKRRRDLYELQNSNDSPLIRRSDQASSTDTIPITKRQRLSKADQQHSSRSSSIRIDDSYRIPATLPTNTPKGDYSDPASPTTGIIQPQAMPTDANTESAVQTLAEPEPEAIVHPQPPEPPLHTLYTILHPLSTRPLPRRNYILSTLVIITYVGNTLISRPNSPFPPKRHIKIEDPSLHLPAHQSRTQRNPQQQQQQTESPLPTPATQLLDKRGKGVTVAIYNNANSFKPAVGTLALFRGLVMQRLSNGDVILNVYPDFKGRRVGVLPDHSLSQEHGFSDTEWCIFDQDRLRKMGYDVKGLLDWWKRRSEELGHGKSD